MDPSMVTDTGFPTDINHPKLLFHTRQKPGIQKRRFPNTGLAVKQDYRSGIRVFTAFVQISDIIGPAEQDFGMLFFVSFQETVRRFGQVFRRQIGQTEERTFGGIGQIPVTNGLSARPDVQIPRESFRRTFASFSAVQTGGFFAVAQSYFVNGFIPSTL